MSTPIEGQVAGMAASKMTTMVVSSVVPIPIVGIALGAIVGALVKSFFGGRAPTPVFNASYWENMDVTNRWKNWTMRCPSWWIIAGLFHMPKLEMLADLYLLHKLSDVGNSISLDRILTASTESLRKGDSAVVMAPVSTYAALPSYDYRPTGRSSDSGEQLAFSVTWQGGWLTGYNQAEANAIMASLGIFRTTQTSGAMPNLVGIKDGTGTLVNARCTGGPLYVQLASLLKPNETLMNILLRDEEGFTRFCTYANNLPMTKMGEAITLEELITGLIQQTGQDDELLAYYYQVRAGEKQWSRTVLGLQHPELPAQIGWQDADHVARDCESRLR